MWQISMTMWQYDKMSVKHDRMSWFGFNRIVTRGPHCQMRSSYHVMPTTKSERIATNDTPYTRRRPHPPTRAAAGMTLRIPFAGVSGHFDCRNAGNLKRLKQLEPPAHRGRAAQCRHYDCPVSVAGSLGSGAVSLVSWLFPRRLVGLVARRGWPPARGPAVGLRGPGPPGARLAGPSPGSRPVPAGPAPGAGPFLGPAPLGLSVRSFSGPSSAVRRLFAAVAPARRRSLLFRPGPGGRPGRFCPFLWGRGPGRGAPGAVPRPPARPPAPLLAAAGSVRLQPTTAVVSSVSGRSRTCACPLLRPYLCISAVCPGDFQCQVFGSGRPIY